jgi:hypothetical protein
MIDRQLHEDFQIDNYEIDDAFAFALMRGVLCVGVLRLSFVAFLAQQMAHGTLAETEMERWSSFKRRKGVSFTPSVVLFISARVGACAFM